MRKIEIIKGVNSSVLGFGCSSILGAVDGNKAKRAIDLALECGINHFDLARSYGYGEAEAFVGNILSSKRQEIVIVSKFGIKANWKAQLLKPLKPLVRYLKKQKKSIEIEQNNAHKNEVSRKDIFHDRLPITSKLMISSLERSLKALKTDYLDLLLIHEPLHTINDIELVIETSTLLKKQGKIKGFGLACVQEQMNSHQTYLDQFDILQFNNSPSLLNYNDLIEQRGNKINLFFSPFNGGKNLLSPEETLKKLLYDFPKSVLLCSMFSETHIKANTKIANS